MISKWIPKWFMAGDIAFISEKIFSQKTEWIFGSFLPVLLGSERVFVDDVPWVLKQPQVSGGRIWKICGICQHLTILSRQYISCLIEKCVLNCRYVPPLWRTFLIWLWGRMRGCYGDKQRYDCWMLHGPLWMGQRGLQKHGPEDKHKHLRT